MTAPDTLLDLADEWTVDYWRLWVELSRYENREACLDRRGYHHRAVLPAAPLLRLAASQQLRREQASLRGRLCKARRCGYVPVQVAERLCAELELGHPALVWGHRWHALIALADAGLVRL